MAADPATKVRKTIKTTTAVTLTEEAVNQLLRQYVGAPATASVTYEGGSTYLDTVVVSWTDSEER